MGNEPRTRLGNLDKRAELDNRLEDEPNWQTNPHKFPWGATPRKPSGGPIALSSFGSLWSDVPQDRVWDESSLEIAQRIAKECRSTSGSQLRRITPGNANEYRRERPLSRCGRTSDYRSSQRRQNCLRGVAVRDMSYSLIVDDDSLHGLFPSRPRDRRESAFFPEYLPPPPNVARCR